MTRPVLALVVLFALAAPSVAQTVATLPPGYWNHPTWVGGQAYFLGGFDWSRPEGPGRGMQEVLRYDPATAQATVTSAQLPTGRWWTGSASDGRYAYVFGGNAWSTFSDEILRYDPMADQVEVLPTRLPEQTEGIGAAFDGTHIYLFGGDRAPDQVLRFDPVTLALERVDARIPPELGWDPRVAWDGERFVLYQFGRFGAFDPATGRTQLLDGLVPSSRGHEPMLLRGDDATILGGGPFGDPVRVDMRSGVRTYLDGDEPMTYWSPRDAWWAGDDVEFVTGSCWNDCALIARTRLIEPAQPPTVQILAASAQQTQDDLGDKTTLYRVVLSVQGSPLYRRALDISIVPGPLQLPDALGPPTRWHSESYDWTLIRPSDRVGMVFTVQGWTPTEGVCLTMTAEPARSDWPDAVSQPFCLLGDDLLPGVRLP